MTMPRLADAAPPVSPVPPKAIGLRHPIATVDVPPEFVVGTRHALRDTLLGHLNRGADVLLDFQHAAYMDSSGLGVLLTVTKHFRAAGRSLVLIQLSSDLLSVLQLTGLDMTLMIQPDADAAIAWLGAQHPATEPTA